MTILCYCNKFVAIKSLPTTKLNQAISIGSKIFAFQHDSKSIFCYDVDEDEWTKESCEATKNIEYFSCVKLPWM